MQPIDPKQLARAGEQLAAAGRELYDHGWVPATSGNFSVRLDSGSCAVTVSGRHKGRLSPADVMAVTLDGTALTDGKPSAETALHTQLYRWRDDIGAVLHCHSAAATTLTRAQPDVTDLLLRDYELLKAFPDVATHATAVVIPVFDNTQDIDTLALAVERRLALQATGPAYLIRGHGVYAWGATIDDCLRHLEALDFMLQCEWQQLLLARTLSRDVDRTGS